MSKFDPAPTLASGILRLARAKAKMTQDELAGSAGVSQQAISSYETGRKDPTVATLERLVGAAGYEIRVRLEPPDSHDEDMSNYIATLSPELRAKIELSSQQRVTNARLARLKGK